MPHYAWPLRFAAAGFAVVEQDTNDERKASAAVIAATPRGWRDDHPDFGVTPLVFEQGPVDVELLATEIAQSDDRLDVQASEAGELVNALRRVITVGVAGAN
ncbi:MAG: hypothetical protein WKF48_05790 [Solirubrobacteraceae bacterium]